LDVLSKLTHMTVVGSSKVQLFWSEGIIFPDKVNIMIYFSMHL